MVFMAFLIAFVALIVIFLSCASFFLCNILDLASCLVRERVQVMEEARRQLL